MGLMWTIVGILVPLLVGLAIGMISLNPPEFLYARICFIVAAVILGIATIVWASITSHPIYFRLLITIPVSLLIGIGLPLSLQWINQRETIIGKQINQVPLDIKSPEFTCEFSTSFSGTFKEKHKIVGVSGVIRNSKGPASGIFDWKMIIEFPDGKKVTGEVPLMTGKDIEIPISSIKDQKIILRDSLYWPKISTEPIIAGRVLDGWFWAVFPNFNLKEAYDKKAVIIIQFRDAVANEIHECKTTLPSPGVHLPVINLP